MTGVDGGSGSQARSWGPGGAADQLLASVILTSPGVNGDGGPSLLIPDREVTPTLETGLCSKGKTAHTSAHPDTASRGKVAAPEVRKERTGEES